MLIPDSRARATSVRGCHGILTPMDSSQLLSSAQEFLEAVPAVQCAYAFGSILTEHFHDGSDVDLAIIANRELDELSVMGLR
jgi:predicted nucleotidyltransferase